MAPSLAERVLMGIGNIVPPIYVADGNDVGIFLSERYVESFLEAKDILDGAYTIYDSLGRILLAEVAANRIKLAVPRNSSTSEEALASLLQACLLTKGVSKESLENAPLNRLVELSKSYSDEHSLATILQRIKLKRG